MLPQILNSTTIPALSQVIGFAQARHQVLAGNVANVNVPGYRVRDSSVETFQQRLKAVMEAPTRQAGRVESPGRISDDPNDQLRQVKESMTNVLYHDDTNLDMKQVAEMSKNQLMHNMAISIMTNQFALMQAAISERV